MAGEVPARRITDTDRLAVLRDRIGERISLSPVRRDKGRTNPRMQIAASDHGLTWGDHMLRLSADRDTSVGESEFLDLIENALGQRGRGFLFQRGRDGWRLRTSATSRLSLRDAIDKAMGAMR